MESAVTEQTTRVQLGELRVDAGPAIHEQQFAVVARYDVDDGISAIPVVTPDEAMIDDDEFRSDQLILVVEQREAITENIRDGSDLTVEQSGDVIPATQFAEVVMADIHRGNRGDILRIPCEDRCHNSFVVLFLLRLCYHLW